MFGARENSNVMLGEERDLEANSSGVESAPPYSVLHGNDRAANYPCKARSLFEGGL